MQADFAFLTTRGEVVDEESEGTIKIFVLTELATNCIGYVVVTSDAREVKGQICKWLDHFGLASSTSSVVLHTDAERAVSEFSRDKFREVHIHGASCTPPTAPIQWWS